MYLLGLSRISAGASFFRPSPCQPLPLSQSSRRLTLGKADSNGHAGSEELPSMEEPGEVLPAADLLPRKKKNKENTKHVHGCHGFVHCVHFGGHGLGLLVLTHSHVLGVGVLSEPSPTLSQHGWGCITKDPHVVVDQMMDMVSRSVSPNMNGARH